LTLPQAKLLVVAYLEFAFKWSIMDYINLVDYHMRRNENSYFYHCKMKFLS